ncbi:MAG: hypothetical protein NW201_11950 [Gemmatimonadales bacterium]|nr:hypothetical protein [Gemmatimonadales bacterium]
MAPPSDLTLGGYLARHERAPAFAGSDGQPYSVAIHVDEAPDARGRFGASLLFVRWSPAGDRPVGHVESEVLAWGPTPADAERRLQPLTLYDVKRHLDEAIARQPEPW